MSDESGDGKSLASSNPPINKDDGEDDVVFLLQKQGAHIDSLVADVAVLRESGIVMENRLQKMHGFLCAFMGDKCDLAFKDMSWTPVIQMHNETQVLKKTKGKKVTIDKDVIRGRKKGEGDVVVFQGDDSLSGDPDETGQRYSVNYEKSLSSDTAGRTLYGVRGCDGYCLTYTLLDYFKFDPKIVSAKTKKALASAGVRSLTDLQDDEAARYVAVLSFVIDLLMSETFRYQDKRPLFLESPIDADDLGRSASVIANVQPEPVRSALALVLKSWGLPESEDLSDIFLRVLGVVEGYVNNLREDHPPCDSKRPEEELHPVGSELDVGGGDGSSAGDEAEE